jgi:hypothetical protein
MGGECRTTKDPLRHVINRVLAEVADKIPAPVVEDLRRSFSRAEDKFKFSIYGGDPSKLVEYLESEDFMDLVSTAMNLNVEWVIKEILESIADEYRVSCPEISEKAKEVLKTLEEKKTLEKKEELEIDIIYRKLRMMGYNPERVSEDTITFSTLGVTVTLSVKNDVLEYTICKKGKAYTLEGLLTKLSKIVEI